VFDFLDFRGVLMKVKRPLILLGFSVPKSTGIKEIKAALRTKLLICDLQ
jgi:hypothetical protein